MRRDTGIKPLQFHMSRHKENININISKVLLCSFAAIAARTQEKKVGKKGRKEEKKGKKGEKRQSVDVLACTFEPRSLGQESRNKLTCCRVGGVECHAVIAVDIRLVPATVAERARNV